MGQENPFGWELIQKGLPMQFEILNEYVKENKCRVMTMAESGEWYKKNFSETPPATIGARNILGNDIGESQWYYCKNYRVNFVSEGDEFYIRDIYKFDETFVENAYSQPCREWSITYENLPVMQGYLWRKAETDRAGIYFDGQFGGMKAYKDGSDFIIEVKLDNETVKISMTEEKITINTQKDIRFVVKDDVNIRFNETEILYRYNDKRYSIHLIGKCDAKGVISPVNGEIVFTMA